jgi:hypothetical protein
MPYPDYDDAEKDRLNLARGGRDEAGRLIRKPAPVVPLKTPALAPTAPTPIGFTKAFTPEERQKQALALQQVLRKQRGEEQQESEY